MSVAVNLKSGNNLHDRPPLRPLSSRLHWIRISFLDLFSILQFAPCPRPWDLTSVSKHNCAMFVTCYRRWGIQNRKCGYSVLYGIRGCFANVTFSFRASSIMANSLLARFENVDRSVCQHELGLRCECNYSQFFESTELVPSAFVSLL